MDIFNGNIINSGLIPFKQNLSVSHTGTLIETKVVSLLIPAGTFQENDWLYFISSINASNNANAKTVRCYLNDTDNLLTPILWGTRNLIAAISQTFERNLIFKNSLISQQTLVGTTLNTSIDYATTTGTLASLAVDFTIDQYFIISVQLSVITDIVTINGVSSLRRR